MWVFEQKTGHLTHFVEGGSPGPCFMGGYSGCDAGKNNPEMQHVHNVGPIPRGVYRIGDPYDSQGHGPFVLPLTPDPANDMGGRAGFLIHGDSVRAPGSASEGCIIVPRFVRESIHESCVKDPRDRMLKVVE